MNILITGAGGFIARNLILKLNEDNSNNIFKYYRGDSINVLSEYLRSADIIIHLAGENRPQNPELFEQVNVGLTKKICDLIKEYKINIPILFSSSTQAILDNPYGRSKLAAEKLIKEVAEKNGNKVFIYRLPGVFGKWCKPNYNSVVATFCNNMANNLPLKVNDPHTELRLVYIDDLTDSFLKVINNNSLDSSFDINIETEYVVKLSDLVLQLRLFKESRTSLLSQRVGEGFTRALYATYISYLPKDDFSYKIPVHADDRGIFVEMIKTVDSGQFSFFSAHPGITRGGHYHNTKTEKFLVIKGDALFKFRHMITNETISIESSGEAPVIIETIPGWAHDITNIGSNEMFVMLWANEIFDQGKPDTISAEV